jgi:hypothetical protein
MSNATQRLTEIEAQEKALADEKAKLLKASKKTDLELVKKLCKQHGFTATNLRGCLTTRGKGEAVEKKSTPKKTTKK